MISPMKKSGTKSHQNSHENPYQNKLPRNLSLGNWLRQWWELMRVSPLDGDELIFNNEIEKYRGRMIAKNPKKIVQRDYPEKNPEKTRGRRFFPSWPPQRKRKDVFGPLQRLQAEKRWWVSI